MKKIDRAKDAYDKIQIPKELDGLIRKAVAEHPREEVDKKYEQMEKEKKMDKVKKFPAFKYAAAAAAAALVCFTAALNTSEVFAKEIGELPVIGSLARVLTVRSYETQEDDKNIRVNIPAVELESETAMNGGETAEQETQASVERLAGEAFVGDINAEIEKLVDDYVADAQKRFDEYKDAFFATGGTEEEWAGRDMDINVDYEVKYQQGRILSLVLSADEGWIAAYGERHYYNLDLVENRRLTLKDILGEDYQEKADASILAQMQERADRDGFVYWNITQDDSEYGEEGFKGVDESTQFYINEKGNPVVCFEKYEVGPGYIGIQEFEVEK